MLEISGKKTVEETAKKENGKIVEPYKRRREDNSGGGLEREEVRREGDNKIMD